ncbi:MAG: N-acetylmuramoyl-L-alanine amidase [Leptospiraceae bacterium]|nr:N-acetylmuramoyl-L-alanine amidase [Leptospiraceae bacterium]
MFYSLPLFCFLWLHCAGVSNSQILDQYKNFHLPVKPLNELGISKDLLDRRNFSQRRLPIQSVVFHITRRLSAKEYIQKSIENSFLVHLVIDKTGTIYGVNNPAIVVYKVSPKMDDSSIHLSLEGTSEEIANNPVQLKIAVQTLKTLANSFSIPLNNKDVGSKKGVFSHLQVKKKFGYFIDLEDLGLESTLELVLLNSNGTYFKEEDWEKRFEKDWIFRKEKLSKENVSKTKDQFDHGRGITEQAELKLNALEKDSKNRTPEIFRLKYKLKQKIEPSCVVLHYTAIKSFFDSQKVLEMRGLSATIMVDNDGKAYQLLDDLDHYPQAATGTNHKCIQIEIVGKNTEELMANEVQSKKVSELVSELSKKFKIPLSNFAIEELYGIYSHTQAKKKFGGSVALIGKDFDPGEPYMEKILGMLGGKYFPEERWKDRKSDDWVIHFAEFHP